MAAQHPGLKKVGDYWHYELRINRQRIHGSTRAKDLQTAKRVLEEVRKNALLDQIGVMRAPTFSVLVNQWLKAHQGIHSARHCNDVEGVSRLWLVPVLGGKRVNHIRGEDVSRVRTRMAEAGKSIVYINDAMKVLKLLCRYAIKMGSIKELPFRIEFLRAQKKPRPIVSASKIPAFLAEIDKAARNPHIPVIIRAMVGLGLRESEALGMRWEWFDAEQRTYTVGKSKGKEARVLPVPDWLWMAIHQMPKTISEWVFPAEDGKPHRPQFCKKPLKRVCKSMGLGNVTQHRLRATFATLHATEANTPITEIQGLLGHKAVTTTMIYIEQALENKRKAQDALARQIGLA